MTISQNHAPHNDIDISHKFDIATAIQEEQLIINRSELMGCNYVFVNSQNTNEFFSGEHLTANAQKLVKILDTNPLQTVIVLITNHAIHRFTRLDPVWKDDQVSQVHALTIDTPDQIAFMEMMLDCSTLYYP